MKATELVKKFQDCDYNVGDIFSVPCCDNCYNGYFDETSCFIGTGNCPNENFAGHGVCCEHYSGLVSIDSLRELLINKIDNWFTKDELQTLFLIVDANIERCGKSEDELKILDKIENLRKMWGYCDE